MNGPTNDDLTNTLNKRADDFARLGGHDLDLAQVIDRAGEIRRGRRMRASMAMAAVALAVAVPVGVTVLDNGSSPITPAPQPTGTATIREPNHDRISLDGLEVGGAPRTGYAAGGALFHGTERLPGGPGADVTGVARVTGGFLVTTRDEQANLEVSYFGDDGSASDETWPVADGSVAVSREGNVGAFVEPDGTVRVVQDSGSRSFVLGRLPAGAYSAEAVVGESCYATSDIEAGCTVYARSLGQTSTIFAVTPQSAEPALKSLLSVAGVTSTGEVAGLVKILDDGTCSSVRDAEGTERWGTCEYRPLSYSPSGARLLAAQAYGDGLGDTRLAVLRADDGEPVLDLTVADGVTLYDLVWEDDEHVLAVAGQGTRFAVIRFSLDGNRELALPVREGPDDTQPPFHLAGS